MSPLGPVYPALQRQSVMASLVAGELELSGQVSQVLVVVSSYWFAGHSMQGVPSSPEYPLLHIQSVMAVLSAGELLLSGQARQLEDPETSVYVPVAQEEHGPPSGPEKP